MSKQVLPKELIEIVHHIKLNEAGWWDKGTKRLILTVFWIENKILTLDDIESGLLSNFKLKIEKERVEILIKSLLEDNDIIEISTNEFKITEDCFIKFGESINKSEQIEKDAKNEFIILLKEHCPKSNYEDIWNNFNNNVLNDLVKIFGAKTYEIISGIISNEAIHPYYRVFIETQPINLQIGIRNVLLNYLDPTNIKVRTYILGLLNTYFFIEAGNLSKNAIDELSDFTKTTTNFFAFVDSNFLFSILDLHDNPSNDAARTLIHLIGSLKNKLNVKLYVSPISINEIKLVLSKQESSLSSIRLTKNIIETADSSIISGFKRRYFQRLKQSNSFIKPNEYFDPYIKNLITILKEKGVDLFNEDFDAYKTKSSVIDDILPQIEHEKSKENPKDYAQLEHDIVLWHFTHDKRPSSIDSPRDAKYWIVTIDFRFLGFDAYKLKTLGESVPVCIHPTTFMQLLQFWVPRDEEFEKAMLGNIRLPLLFGTFDHEAEGITLEILRTISRFEDIEDLPTETVKNIVINEAVRSKIISTKDVSEKIELVKAAIIEENQRILKDVDRLKSKLNIKDQVILIKDLEIEKKSNETNSLIEQNTEISTTLNILKDKVDTLEKEREANRLFNLAKQEYGSNKINFTNQKWDAYISNKNYSIKFGLFLILVVISMCLCHYFLPDNWRNIIPFVIFAGTFVLSFFNRDKIAISLLLIFRRKKTQKKKTEEFEKEYSDSNIYPKLEDFNRS